MSAYKFVYLYCPMFELRLVEFLRARLLHGFTFIFVCIFRQIYSSIGPDFQKRVVTYSGGEPNRGTLLNTVRREGG